MFKLCSKDFKAQMKSFAEDLPWEKFKCWPPKDYDQYDIYNTEECWIKEG